ncbi:tRNA glutamyl-Q(34) synthetase GluQRS [Zhihengliuella salsuginis]|uniref:Glutamyl-Q tRNA(Asp) synthetase n=1 Tax=Zhihengliuella salsuginis TaxID=578222 RepID=A0ABQ3GAR4_9MICC|nr:tRNA glutamyl-Q(34) synthetase GluQRS [Zhihengliuella salsuginis]GHC99977.1 glutamyl-Q tRNA(Asp) synthetase [Zhihengliuella salsuginis]
MGAGRFAPSPSGELHLGNLRTAILAWLFARSTGRDFLLRVEDLDRARAGAEEVQLRDLEAVGLSWDGIVERQTERTAGYDRALEQLRADGLLYECFCTRRDIADAPRAPHAAPGAYPGTCRDLTEGERARRRSERPAALRLRSAVDELTVADALAGDYTGVVDDFVIRRNDGVPAYNFAVVVDDDLQGIDQVVRGDDLLSSTPRQAHLAALLGAQLPGYAHVPLVLNPMGKRLAKRDGAVTLGDLSTGFAADGNQYDAVAPAAVRDVLLASLGLPAGPLEQALEVFEPAALPREPWIFDSPSTHWDSSTGTTPRHA